MSTKNTERRAPVEKQPIALATAEEAGKLPAADRRADDTPSHEEIATALDGVPTTTAAGLNTPAVVTINNGERYVHISLFRRALNVASELEMDAVEQLAAEHV